MFLLSLSEYFFASLYMCDIVVGQCHQPQCHSNIIRLKLKQWEAERKRVETEKAPAIKGASLGIHIPSYPNVIICFI